MGDTRAYFAVDPSPATLVVGNTPMMILIYSR
jgi:hypothetical protein